MSVVRGKAGKSGWKVAWLVGGKIIINYPWMEGSVKDDGEIERPKVTDCGNWGNLNTNGGATACIIKSLIFR